MENLLGKLHYEILHREYAVGKFISILLGLFIFQLGMGTGNFWDRNVRYFLSPNLLPALMSTSVVFGQYPIGYVQLDIQSNVQIYN